MNPKPSPLAGEGRVMGVEKPIVATLPPTHFPRGRNCKAIKSIDEMTFKKFSQSLAFCSLLLAAPAVFAATELVPPSAQLAFPLENQGGSARANAMGSAFVAVGGDVSALSWNPAALPASLPPNWPSTIIFTCRI